MQPWEVARRQLGRGETLVWADRVSPGAQAARQAPVAGFGALFLGMALFMADKASGFGRSSAFGGLHSASGPPAIFMVVIAGFVALGAGIVLSPLWAWWVGKSSVYAVTDRRLMIIRTAPQHSVQSFGPGDLNRLIRKDGQGGRGDLIFRRAHRSKHSERIQQFGFYDIAEVKRVEQAVADLRDGRLGGDDAPANIWLG